MTTILIDEIQGKLKLLKDIEDCNKELDKLPKPFKLYGHMGELDACWYAFRFFKNYEKRIVAP